MTFSLATVAPRLALARDQHLVEMARARSARFRARHNLLSAERLVAHRDLQLVRAYSTGRRRYIADRAYKLEAARKQLERAQRRAEQIGAIPQARRTR